MGLSMLLAAALWQKARDQSAICSTRRLAAAVSPVDGLIAVMFFFVAQAVPAAVIIAEAGSWRGRAFAFSIGGRQYGSALRFAKAKRKVAAISATPPAAARWRGARRRRGGHALSFRARAFELLEIARRASIRTLRRLGRCRWR